MCSNSVPVCLCPDQSVPPPIFFNNIGFRNAGQGCPFRVGFCLTCILCFSKRHDEAGMPQEIDTTSKVVSQEATLVEMICLMFCSAKFTLHICSPLHLSHLTQWLKKGLLAIWLLHILVAASNKQHGYTLTLLDFALSTRCWG